MQIEYIPIKQMGAHLRAGWTLVQEVEFKPRDYAVLMHPPAEAKCNKSAGRISALSRLKGPTAA